MYLLYSYKSTSTDASSHLHTQQKRARSREAALRAQGGRECDELKGRVDRAHLGVQVLDLLALLVQKYKY